MISESPSERQTRVYVHPEGAEPARADKALSAFLSAEISRSRLEESFKNGDVKINGEPILKKRILEEGDIVEAILPVLPPAEVKPVDIPVEVLYEDEDVVVANKPAGMTVHPGSGTGEDTLCHAMMHRCGGKLSLAGGAMRPGIVHRLDKETSGVMIMAKTDEAYYNLVKMFSERDMQKAYVALVCGVPSVRTGSIQKPIARHPEFRTKMCVADDSTGRDAHTDWEMLESFGSDAALLKCIIHTGRTHQIRVHLSSIGFPILGDYTYSFQKNKMKKIEPPQRVMLHAYSLKMRHPVDPSKTIEVSAKPPRDFLDLIEKLRETANM
ncbi:MAG: RluA family pseudouridine synthase [Opitutales bacterium]|nr:RluA family pseudouridine synthase [Opitutales bacterium]